MEINNELERVAMTTYPVVVLFLFKRKFLKTERKISTPGVPPGICQNHQYCDIFDSKKKLTHLSTFGVNFLNVVWGGRGC